MLARLVSGDISKVLDGLLLGGPKTLREMREGGWDGPGCQPPVSLPGCQPPCQPPEH